MIFFRCNNNNNSNNDNNNNNNNNNNDNDNDNDNNNNNDNDNNNNNNNNNLLWPHSYQNPTPFKSTTFLFNYTIHKNYVQLIIINIIILN